MLDTGPLASREAAASWALEGGNQVNGLSGGAGRPRKPRTKNSFSSKLKENKSEFHPNTNRRDPVVQMCKGV